MTKTNDSITCQACGASVSDSIREHLPTCPSGKSIEEYKKDYPLAPLMSKSKEEKVRALAAKREKEKSGEPSEGKKSKPSAKVATGKKPMSELFGIKVKSSSDKDIHVTVLESHDSQDLVPDRELDYIHNEKVLKLAMYALETNTPALLWGHAGVGKTTLWHDICAATNRPIFRVNHTINMEESNVVGQWVVKDGETQFELGPLAVAMSKGYVYLADEYDIAPPAVIAVYQAVLEGKPLVIKEADEGSRIVRPHPNFRFTATGNTNGMGDETGLYAGTMIQNAANYDRFGVVQRVPYPPMEKEREMVRNQVKGIEEEDVERLTEFANRMRTLFEEGNIGMPISPRAVCKVGSIGVAFNSMTTGVEVGYANRLSNIDSAAAMEAASRIWGDAL